jgi:transcriptional regulator with AAA-type ATPase domain
MGEVSNFNRFSKEIYREGNLRELAEKLSKLAMTAKQHTLQETEDWFDKITVNRNMKDLTSLSNQFKKVATEAQGLQERMGGLYEDMGHILGRYYEIHEPGHEDDVASEGKSYRDGDEVEADTVQEGSYEDFFKSALKKWGVSAPDDLEDDEKVKFFNYVDANWSGENESD